MKKSQLKEIIKPIVQECIDEAIHEALFDSGIVSEIISEVIRGVNIPMLVESLVPKHKEAPKPVQIGESNMASIVSGASRENVTLNSQRNEFNAEMAERRTMLESKFKDTLGIDVFEGTTPTLKESSGQGPLDGVDPRDPGVSLSNIPGLTTLNFSRHIKG